MNQMILEKVIMYQTSKYGVVVNNCGKTHDSARKLSIYGRLGKAEVGGSIPLGSL